MLCQYIGRTSKSHSAAVAMGLQGSATTHRDEVLEALEVPRDIPHSMVGVSGKVVQLVYIQPIAAVCNDVEHEGLVQGTGIALD